MPAWAQSFADHLGILPVGEQQGGAGVSQVVEPQRGGKRGQFQEPLKGAPNVRVVERLPGGRREHEVETAILVARGEPCFSLCASMRLQAVANRRRERNRPTTLGGF